MAWQIKFEPTIVFMTPSGSNKFKAAVSSPTTAIAAPGGAFPIVTRIRPRFTVDLSGGDPLAPPATSPATIVFLARIKSTRAADPYTAIGTLPGTMDFVTVGKKQLPRFTAAHSRVGTNQVLNYQPSTAIEASRSDWVVSIDKHPDQFIIDPVQSFTIRLPWLFNETNPVLQFNARLSLGAAVAIAEAVNTPLDIPLRQTGIPEDLDTSNKDLTFFGVENVVPTKNIRPKIPLGTHRVLVFIDPSVTTFLTGQVNAAALAQMRAAIRATLEDLGIPAASLQVVMTGDATFGAESTRFAGFFTQTRGRFHSTRLTNVTAPSPTSSSKKVFIPDGFILDGEGSTVPFFEFFVGLENNDPPDPHELGEGEIFNEHPGPSVNIGAATKLIAAPIRLMGGPKGLLKTLGNMVAGDRANALANVICHEIGHSLGLGHGVSFDGTNKYVDVDPGDIRNSIMYIGLIEQSDPAGGSSSNRCRPNFFGPVHRNVLRTTFSIP